MKIPEKDEALLRHYNVEIRCDATRHCGLITINDRQFKVSLLTRIQEEENITPNWQTKELSHEQMMVTASKVAVMLLKKELIQQTSSHRDVESSSSLSKFTINHLGIITHSTPLSKITYHESDVENRNTKPDYDSLIDYLFPSHAMKEDEIREASATDEAEEKEEIGSNEDKELPLAQINKKQHPRSIRIKLPRIKIPRLLKREPAKQGKIKEEASDSTEDVFQASEMHSVEKKYPRHFHLLLQFLNRYYQPLSNQHKNKLPLLTNSSLPPKEQMQIEKEPLPHQSVSILQHRRMLSYIQRNHVLPFLPKNLLQRSLPIADEPSSTSPITSAPLSSSEEKFLATHAEEINMEEKFQHRSKAEESIEKSITPSIPRLLKATASTPITPSPYSFILRNSLSNLQFLSRIKNTLPFISPNKIIKTVSVPPIKTVWDKYLDKGLNQANLDPLSANTTENQAEEVGEFDIKLLQSREKKSPSNKQPSIHLSKISVASQAQTPSPAALVTRNNPLASHDRVPADLAAIALKTFIQGVKLLKRRGF